MKGNRNRQLLKAYNWLEKSGNIKSIIIPSHIDVEGIWHTPEYVDVYPDELDIYRQIYGNKLIEIVD